MSDSRKKNLNTLMKLIPHVTELEGVRDMIAELRSALAKSEEVQSEGKQVLAILESRQEDLEKAKS